MPRGRRGREKAATVLPKTAVVAATENDIAGIDQWLSSKPDLEAKAVVAISVGDEVKAKVRAESVDGSRRTAPPLPPSPSLDAVPTRHL